MNKENDTEVYILDDPGSRNTAHFKHTLKFKSETFEISIEHLLALDMEGEVYAHWFKGRSKGYLDLVTLADNSKEESTNEN